MIKMYIDNEEVVCNKEFTINEEMLSTSSTILNNCYPKSWEQDHDYVSNFYYPKDYSKCLIYDELETYPNIFDLESFYNNCSSVRCTKELITNGIKISFNAGADVWIGDAVKTGSTITQTMKNTCIEVQPLTEYTLSMSSMPRCYISYLDNNYNPINSSYIQMNSKYTQTSYTFTTPTSTKYVLFRFGILNNSYTEWEFTNIELVAKQPVIQNNLLFAGMVKNSGDISLNPRYPKYCSLEILDFKDFLSTGDMLDFVISNKTITEAISMVIDAVNQYGFVLGNVSIDNAEEIIGAYSTLNKSAYDVFQYLADISGSRWTTRMIDENTVAIDFYDPTLMPSGIDIEYTKEWWCTHKVLDLTFNYGTRDYRNKQVMLSDEVYGGVDYDETIIADGYNTNYITTTNVAEIKAISVNGTPMTFATTYDKELGVEADFYYTFGNNTIETNETYLAGTVINIGYTPLVKGREVVSNEDEINRVSNNTGRKGVIARYENRNDVLSSNELKMIGETYIKYKGSAEVIITLKTQTDLYNVGQSVYFDAPIEELNTEYMVKKKSIEYIANINEIFYTYELSSSFNSEAAINWFDNQRNKATGNIAEGESITRNIDIESKATIIFSNATATEITITDTNVLNAPLNAPFTQ